MSIVRSGISWFFASIGGVAVSWLAAMYFTRALAEPDAALGQFYLFESIVSFFMLVSTGGVHGAITKRVSGSQNEKEKSRYAGAGILLSGILVIISTVLIVMAAPFISDQFGMGGISVLFILGTVWAMQVRSIVIAFLSGEGKVGTTAWIGSFDTFSRTGIQSLLIFFGYGLFGLLAGTVMGVSLAAIISLLVLSTGIRIPSRKQIDSLLHYAKYDFLSGFATKFYDNIDILVINYFIGSAATGIYGIGFRFSLILKIFAGAISQTSMPHLSHYSEDGNWDRVEEILTDATVFGTILSIPAFVGMLVIGERLVVTFYTGEFANAAIIATVAVAVQIPDSLRSVFISALSGIDHPEITYRGGAILIVGNLILDLLLVPTIGPLGAVVASLVAVICAMIYLGIKLFALLGLSPRRFPYEPILYEVIAASVMGIILSAIDKQMNLASIPSLILLIPTGIIIYFLIILLISNEIRDRLLGILKDIIPNKVIDE